MFNWCEHLRTRFDTGVGSVGASSTEVGSCYVYLKSELPERV